MSSENQEEKVQETSSSGVQEPANKVEEQREYRPLRRESARKDHLQSLLVQKKAQERFLEEMMGESVRSSATDPREVLTESNMGELEAQSEIIQLGLQYLNDYKKHCGDMEYPIEVRMSNLKYTVPMDEASSGIVTVYNSSPVYHISKYLKRLWRREKKKPVGEKIILDDVSLVLKPGKMYLLLGPPAAGKTSLLRAISGTLSLKKGGSLEGTVSYNGKEMNENDLHISNVIAYIEQLDRHAPRLSVDETFEFAFQCKAGGTHVANPEFAKTPEAKEFVQRLDSERMRIGIVLEALGLDHVRDTYVGDQNVRGISGGQRRRVTFGEMLMDRSPILCGDEISTGLDAASTYDIVKSLSFFGKLQQLLRVVSLLQPSPETVSLFDEVILLAEGQLTYCGPIADVEGYFGSIGYKAPDQMDIADFLQHLTISSDAAKVFDPPEDIKDKRTTPYRPSELADIFRASKLGKAIQDDLNSPVMHSLEPYVEEPESDNFETYKLRRKYANTFPRSAWLNLKRLLTLWVRDRRVLISNLIKIIIMGASVGGVFYQTDNFVSILGVLFQGTLFILLSAMNNAPGLIDERVIFYKHKEANFFSAYPYVVARALSQLPQTSLDISVYGSFLYWMVGLTATAENFLIFLAILFVFSVCFNQMLSVYGAVATTKATVFVLSACTLLVSMLFCGFIVAPDAVPDYYIWIYWWNPLAWAYRALVVNEFRSSDYSKEEGDEILVITGFVDANDEPFGQQWVGYSFAYMIPYTVLNMFFTALGLTYVRVSEDSAPEPNHNDDQTKDLGEVKEEEVHIPFEPVNLTFENMCYDVQASKKKETLRLLNNVNGFFGAGRMCALMGESGAGKTTLMDVIALRKNTGTVAGDVRLNGFLQEPASFRRCSGYVEQFDVQSAELTVRETVLFSARLRLNPELLDSDDKKQDFVDNVLRTLELQSLSDCIVGNDEEGGLSFEQKKRLSIAVELAASPSIIFLDEPTSGLDARSALLVVKILRKIASQGRTICATIHQPSSTVFSMFDDLLLLKKGGKVVFFGDLGPQCQNLIEYFEERGAPPIQLGENPANWMLKAITEHGNKDLAEEYICSTGFKELQGRLEQARSSPDPAKKITFSTEFAVNAKARSGLVNARLSTIYWRSPAYNYARLLVSVVIAFLLGSIFLGDRRPEVLTESQMNGLLSCIFLSFIIIGILSITSVLPLMESIRNMFYRHQAAGMVDYKSVAYALGVAEKKYIILSSFLFCIIFIPVSGLDGGWKGAIGFWGFFTFNSALYSYFGQAFMCLVGPMAAAQILGTIFIGLNNFFSGLIVRPQYLSGFFEIPYWITPGHYVYEGMVMSQFGEDDRLVSAEEGSDFYVYLECDVDDCRGVNCNTDDCGGTVAQFVDSFFGEEFDRDNIPRDAVILGAFLLSARALTFLGLRLFKHAS